MNRIIRTIVALTALFPALLATQQVTAAETTMRLASATINDVQHEWQKTFAALLADKVGDRVETQIFPASQLGTIPRMAEGVLLGTIESFITPTAFLSGTAPRFQIFDSPGLFDSPEHVGRVIHDPVYRDHIETLALDKGLRVIGVIFNSPMLILTNDPVRTLDDMKGLKVRTFASPLQMEPMKAIGASPLPLALSEVVPALQTGNIDGMLAGMPILTAFKFYDVATHVTALHFQQIVSVNVVNEAWFQAQAEDIRAAILAAGRESETGVLQWGIDNVGRANQAWLDNGGEIISLPDEDQARMMALFAEVGAKALSADADVAAEYERLVAVVNASKGQ